MNAIRLHAFAMALLIAMLLSTSVTVDVQQGGPTACPDMGQSSDYFQRGKTLAWIDWGGKNPPQDVYERPVTLVGQYEGIWPCTVFRVVDFYFPKQ